MLNALIIDHLVNLILTHCILLVLILLPSSEDCPQTCKYQSVSCGDNGMTKITAYYNEIISIFMPQVWAIKGQGCSDLLSKVSYSKPLFNKHLKH